MKGNRRRVMDMLLETKKQDKEETEDIFNCEELFKSFVYAFEESLIEWAEIAVEKLNNIIMCQIRVLRTVPYFAWVCDNAVAPLVSFVGSQENSACGILACQTLAALMCSDRRYRQAAIASGFVRMANISLRKMESTSLNHAYLVGLTAVAGDLETRPAIAQINIDSLLAFFQMWDEGAPEILEIVVCIAEEPLNEKIIRTIHHFALLSVGRACIDPGEVSRMFYNLSAQNALDVQELVHSPVLSWLIDNMERSPYNFLLFLSHMLECQEESRGIVHIDVRRIVEIANQTEGLIRTSALNAIAVMSEYQDSIVDFSWPCFAGLVDRCYLV